MERVCRKKVLIILAVFVGCYAGSLSQVFAQADGKSPESQVKVLARSYPTPEKLACFLNERLVFERDSSLFGRSDYWQRPEEFLANGAGDCEDYALLAQAVLEQQGKEAFLFSLYGTKGYAHTVCVFVENSRYNVMNEGRLLRYQAESLEELADRLYSSWDWAAIAVERGHRGCALKKIYNPARRPLPRGERLPL